MKVSYDPKTDTLTVIFREESKIAESDEDKPGAAPVPGSDLSNYL